MRMISISGHDEVALNMYVIDSVSIETVLITVNYDTLIHYMDKYRQLLDYIFDEHLITSEKHFTHESYKIYNHN